MTNAVLTVALVDDDEVMLDSLTRLLAPHGIVVAWCATDGAQALTRLEDEPAPDVLVVDVAMPGLSGHEVVRRSVARHPYLPVVLLTAVDSASSLREALRSGARGYLVKHDPPERLASLLRLASDGQPVWSESPARHLAEVFAPDLGGARPLSGLQLEVLRMAADGLTNEQISRQRGCSINTVKHHFTVIYERLGAKDRSSAVAIAVRARLL